MKKKIKLNGKLSFNKETIAKLDDSQMSQVEGGSTGCVSIVIRCSLDCTRDCVIRTTIQSDACATTPAGGC